MRCRAAPPAASATRINYAASRSAQGISFFDRGEAGQGIVHVMAPQLAITLPGATLICGDSHTCTNGRGRADRRVVPRYDQRDRSGIG
jgi:homoaconitase/3-isopropylmalate dehydratase large subunit